MVGNAQAAGSRADKSEREAEAAQAELKEREAKARAKAKEAERQLRDSKERLAAVQAELVRPAPPSHHPLIAVIPKPTLFRNFRFSAFLLGGFWIFTYLGFYETFPGHL